MRGSQRVWLGVVGLTGFLMVSTWRFWSGKEINLSGRHPFQFIVLLGVLIYLLVHFSEVLLFLCCLPTCSPASRRAPPTRHSGGARDASTANAAREHDNPSAGRT